MDEPLRAPSNALATRRSICCSQRRTGTSSDSLRLFTAKQAKKASSKSVIGQHKPPAKTVLAPGEHHERSTASSRQSTVG